MANINDNITIFDVETYIDGEYIGVTDEVQLSPSQETKDFKDARGNKYQSISLVASLTGSMKIRDMSVKNFLLGLQAVQKDVEADTAQEFNVTGAEVGKTYFLPDVKVSSVSVSKNSSVVPLGNYVVDAEAGSVKITGSEAAGNIVITYNRADQTHLGLLAADPLERRVEFVVTRLHDNSKFRAGVYRAKFKIAKELSLAGNDYTALPVEFESLADNSATNDPQLGKFGYIKG